MYLPMDYLIEIHLNISELVLHGEVHGLVVVSLSFCCGFPVHFGRGVELLRVEGGAFAGQSYGFDFFHIKNY